MKLNDIREDIILEGITFSPSKLVDDGDGGKFYDSPGKNQLMPCEVCDGKGKEDYGNGEVYPCGYCDGKGKRMEWVPEGPELSVANNSAFLILDMLGLDSSDYAGAISNKDLPAIKRKIIQLKNTSVDAHIREPSEERGPARMDTSGDVPRITRGATMIDSGYDKNRLISYLDRFMKVVDYAQKHGMDISYA